MTKTDYMDLIAYVSLTRHISLDEAKIVVDSKNIDYYDTYEKAIETLNKE